MAGGDGTRGCAWEPGPRTMLLFRAAGTTAAETESSYAPPCPPPSEGRGLCAARGWAVGAAEGGLRSHFMR